jgi:diguanylate cyclase (GGDEF)-like protein
MELTLIRHALSVLIFLFSGLMYAQDSLFLLESEPILAGDKVELNGDWWFEFGQHLSPTELMPRIQDKSLMLVPTPSSWHKFLEPDSANPSLHGIATYATRIIFDSKPSKPISVLVPYVNDGYRIMWMPYNKPEQAIFLGQSGDWQAGINNAREDMLYAMPAEKDGILFAYIAKTRSFQGGLREPLTVQNSQIAQNFKDINNFTRALMMGAIFIMSIHYLVQYFHWRNNTSLLLLSLICIVMFARSLGVSGNTDLLLSYITPEHYIIRLRAEYLTIVFAPTAFLHFFHSLIRNIFPKRLIQVIWIYTAIFGLLTLLIPYNSMTKNLLVYQTHMIVISVVALGSLIWPAWKGKPFARLLLIGTTILAIGVLNDVYASLSETYHVYLIEFFVFFFLLFQAQVVGIKLNETVSLSARLKAEKQKLEHKHDKVLLDSQLDHLTGLYNRKAFDELFNLTWQHAHISQESLSIILIDLDHFKEINDVHGHLIGDEVLIYIASLLRSQSLRKGDFISRYGGEEFVLILPDTRLEDAYNIAEKLRIAVAHAPVYEDNLINLNVTTSIGVYATIPKEDNYKTALGKADEALYKAKNSGRNCVVSLVD